MENLKPVELRLSDGRNTVNIKFINGEPMINIEQLSRVIGLTSDQLKEVYKITETVQRNYAALKYLVTQPEKNN